MIRITGGLFRGRIIKTPKGLRTRPSTDFLRKAVFDILQQEISHAAFLDLFAGSGAFGLEALSRGAAKAVFLDHHPAAIKCIKQNIQTLHLNDRSEVVYADAKKWVKKNKAVFDIAYIDPPYENTVIYSQIMQSFDLLKTAKILLVEANTEKLPEPSLNNLICSNIRKYGSSYVHIYRIRE